MGFWAFYILILFGVNSSHDDQLNNPWYDKFEIGLLFMVGAITYLNDLFILPHYFKREAYLPYAIITLGLLFLTTYIYCYFILGCTDSIITCFYCDFWLIALPIVLLSFLWVVMAFFEKQRELDRIQKEKVEMELKFLKAQINPHVLFNSLNTIYSKSFKENEDIAELIHMLSENLKYVLNQSNDAKVDIEKDLTFIDNFIEFQKLRTQGIHTISYQKEIDSYNYTIAPLILIDFIENAFKHSSHREDETSEIDIQIKIREGNLDFYCSNPINHRIEEKKADSTQIGTKNIKKRLDLLYGGKHDLIVQKSNDTYNVHLKLILL